jgi:uncharacterized iron-regulated membrane protein
MKLVLQIAGGIILAFALIIGVSSAYVAYETRQAAKAIQQATEAMQQATAKAAAKAAAAAKARQEEQAAQIRREEERRAEDARKRAAAAAAAQAKETAWKAYYKPSRDCENLSEWNATVKCANHRMKARSEFERNYKPHAG